MNRPLRIAILEVILLAMVGSAVAADKRWSMTQERYSCFTSGMTLQELASGGVTVLSHTPATKEYCEEARRWGIKACPYVSLYKVIDSTKGDWNTREIEYVAHLHEQPLLDSPFWKELDVAKHPEWCLLREDGQIRRPFDDPNYRSHFQQSCCNHRDLMAAYRRGVQNLMELGAGGVFVDNVHPYPECFGHKLGLHTHDWPDKTNADCYKLILDAVYETVKSYGNDRIVILNPGGPRQEYFASADCVMCESFLWRSACDGDQTPFSVSRRWEPRTWTELLDMRARWQPSDKHGPAIAPLTYLPDPADEAQHAFFAYAAAKLAGFDQWTGTCAKRRDILRRLYRVETGDATSSIVEADGIAYRQFQNALLVCNHSDRTVTTRIPLPPAFTTDLVELFGLQPVPVANNEVVLEMPAESGRVIVSRLDAINNVLREVDGQALAAQLYIEQKLADPINPNGTELRKQLRGIQSIVATIRQHGSNEDATSLGNGGAASLHQIETAKLAELTSDPFLAERLDNLQRHASFAAALVTR